MSDNFSITSPASNTHPRKLIQARTRLLSSRGSLLENFISKWDLIMSARPDEAVSRSSEDGTIPKPPRAPRFSLFLKSNLGLSWRGAGAENFQMGFPQTRLAATTTHDKEVSNYLRGETKKKSGDRRNWKIAGQLTIWRSVRHGTAIETWFRCVKPIEADHMNDGGGRQQAGNWTEAIPRGTTGDVNSNVWLGWGAGGKGRSQLGWKGIVIIERGF